jgi:hypothetical protein
LNLNPVYFWPLHSKCQHYTEFYPNSGKTSPVLHPRPTTGYEVDVIFENEINQRSSANPYLLEPKSHLIIIIIITQWITHVRV